MSIPSVYLKSEKGDITLKKVIDYNLYDFTIYPIPDASFPSPQTIPGSYDRAITVNSINFNENSVTFNNLIRIFEDGRVFQNISNNWILQSNYFTDLYKGPKVYFNNLYQSVINDIKNKVVDISKPSLYLLYGSTGDQRAVTSITITNGYFRFFAEGLGGTDFHEITGIPLRSVNAQGVPLKRADNTEYLEFVVYKYDVENGYKQVTRELYNYIHSNLTSSNTEIQEIWTNWTRGVYKDKSTGKFIKDLGLWILHIGRKTERQVDIINKNSSWNPSPIVDSTNVNIELYNQWSTSPNENEGVRYQENGNIYTVYWYAPNGGKEASDNLLTHDYKIYRRRGGFMNFPNKNLPDKNFSFTDNTPRGQTELEIGTIDTILSNPLNIVVVNIQGQTNSWGYCEGGIKIYDKQNNELFNLEIGEGKNRDGIGNFNLTKEQISNILPSQFPLKVNMYIRYNGWTMNNIRANISFFSIPLLSLIDFKNIIFNKTISPTNSLNINSSPSIFYITIPNDKPTNRIFVYQTNNNKLLHITDYIPKGTTQNVTINYANNNGVLNVTSSVVPVNPLPVPQFIRDGNVGDYGSWEGKDNLEYNCAYGEIFGNASSTNICPSTFIYGECKNIYDKNIKPLDKFDLIMDDTDMREGEVQRLKMYYRDEEKIFTCSDANKFKRYGEYKCPNGVFSSIKQRSNGGNLTRLTVSCASLTIPKDSSDAITWSKNPINPIAGGNEGNMKTYVCRTNWDGYMVPGKFHPNHNKCYYNVPNIGEKSSGNYQLADAISNLTWKSKSDASVKKIEGGINPQDGTVSYICRVKVNNDYAPGNEVNNKCYYQYNGANNSDTYELLSSQ
jgi:hypothetical protein